MINTLAPNNQQLVSLKFFPDATHGWDHLAGGTFYDPRACKGKGCMNTNIIDEEVTKEGISDLIDFLGKALHSK
jgi:dienelactone hydrolase